MVGHAPSVTPHEALAAARLWDPRASEPTHIRNGENSTWNIGFGRKRWILRLTSETHRTRDQLEAELELIYHLAAGGLHVARAIEALDRQRIVDASQSVGSSERIYAALFVHLEGRHFEYHSADVDRPLFDLWGRTMGRLHALSRDFEPAGQHARPDWPDDEVAGCSASGLGDDDELLPLRDQLIAWLRREESEPAHYGMVHGDFERTNFLLRDGSMQIFDFDDCCRHWFCWDIACALSAFRNAGRDERARFLGWFLEGYAAVREPDTARMERFSDLIRLRTVSLLLHRIRKTELATSKADEEWIQRTRNWLGSTWSW
jgi:Ser/Thr protein kinase RdoA (MazF antagonist)